MSSQALRDSQLLMARYLRDPEGAPAPEGVEERRLKIYQDLIYRNIEGFISSGFPVLRSVYAEEDWHSLVHAFIEGHRCRSPYFLEISQEFLNFLLEQYQPRECDPPFLTALAHYEWVELALDVSEETLPAETPTGNPLHLKLALSPLAWVLAYPFPVHRIGRAYQPTQAGETTYLGVYRDRRDKVQFMELNAATARLLELCRDQAGSRGEEVLARLADEMDMDRAALLDFGAGQLREFIDLAVVVGMTDS